jgi:hypothetical protein
MSVGREYLPPRVQVDVFNPDNFTILGDTTSTVTNQQTVDLLKAQTDAITALALVQDARIDSLVLPLNYIFIPVNFTSTFNNTSYIFDTGFMTNTNYFYIFTYEIHFQQNGANSGGTVFAIPGVTILSNFANQVLGFQTTPLFTGSSGSQFAHPSIRGTVIAQGQGSNLTTTLAFPMNNGTLNTNPNSYVATGTFSVIGIKITSP